MSTTTFTMPTFRLRLKALSRVLLLASSLLLATSVGAQSSIGIDEEPASANVAPAAPQPYCTGDSVETFELMTGQMFSTAGEEAQSIPGSLQLTECLERCRAEASCLSVNFETGLCVLIKQNADTKPAGLQPSQFPVFTIYGQKVCLPRGARGACAGRPWAFERVPGFALRRFNRKTYDATASRLVCSEKCLAEADFVCRSFNYDSASGACVLSDQDRHTLSSFGAKHERSLMPAGNATTDYFESNCVQEPNKLCDFKPTKGKILKTVDSVYQDIGSVEACKEKCLGAPYRCFSFDFGSDASASVCRTSHLDKASLSHIDEPYLDVPQAVTYELNSCYNVTILCRAREMIARVQTSKLFNGKLYAKSKPNSCVNDVSTPSLDFEIAMPFHDVMCDVKQTAPGTFSGDIIIQHHDMIVTTQDLGLSVHCNYDLSNRSVSNVNLEVEGDLQNREDGTDTYVHSSVVVGPNVTMLISDRDGKDVKAAQVGDPLALRFEILEKSSPYEIFVRDLVAVDGVDASEITLIDHNGCPTDASLMSTINKLPGSKTLEATFEAFKFPTSNIVQFRAVVTPCLFACEPTGCELSTASGTRQADSYGRRRRAAGGASTTHATHSNKSQRKLAPHLEEEVVVAGIKITDAFNFRDNQELDLLEASLDRAASCADRSGLIVAFVVFVAAQLVLVGAWAFMWRRVKEQRHAMAKQAMYGHLFGYAPSVATSVASSHAYNHHHHHGGHHHHADAACDKQSQFGGAHKPASPAPVAANFAKMNAHLSMYEM